MSGINEITMRYEQNRINFLFWEIDRENGKESISVKPFEVLYRLEKLDSEKVD
jgi:hypothetical protein